MRRTGIGQSHRPSLVQLEVIPSVLTQARLLLACAASPNLGPWASVALRPQHSNWAMEPQSLLASNA